MDKMIGKRICQARKAKQLTSPVFSDIVALARQMDESQQQFVLDFIKMYLSHFKPDSL